MVEGARCAEDCEGVSRYWPCSGFCECDGRALIGVVADMGRAEGGSLSELGDSWSCILCDGDSLLRSGAVWLLSPSVLVAGRPAVGAGLLPDCGLSSLEATRVMGGSCGG